jgi:Carbohydrate esterase, sialic acid-specific acetylesterase
MKTNRTWVLLVSLFFLAAFTGKENGDTLDGMGDKKNVWVFILAGQSNMAGRGLIEPQDTVTNSKIFTINKNGEIILAKEPLHFYEPTLANLDCGLSFGKELVKHIPKNIQILLIPTAVGGSSISQWINDSTFRKVKLYSNFEEKVKIGKERGTIKGILWHQGESDSKGENVGLYEGRLKILFEKFRNTVGNNSLPILIGELGSFSRNKPGWKAINEHIYHYASTDKNVSIITTQDFKHKGDSIHFNSEGQREMGKRFALEFAKRIK